MTLRYQYAIDSSDVVYYLTESQNMSKIANAVKQYIFYKGKEFIPVSSTDEITPTSS
jgi:hypothetical protein